MLCHHTNFTFLLYVLVEISWHQVGIIPDVKCLHSDTVIQFNTDGAVTHQAFHLQIHLRGVLHLA